MALELIKFTDKLEYTNLAACQIKLDEFALPGDRQNII